MGKRHWSRKRLIRLIRSIGAQGYQGADGPPGPQGIQGPPGPPGYCLCSQPLKAPWQQPIISYTGTDSTTRVIYEDGIDGINGIGVDQPMMQAVPYTCGCSWVGLATSMAPMACPSHPMSGGKK